MITSTRFQPPPNISEINLTDNRDLNRSIELVNYLAYHQREAKDNNKSEINLDATTIRKKFGTRYELGKYLYSQLIHQVNDYYRPTSYKSDGSIKVQGICREYIIRDEALTSLNSAILKQLLQNLVNQANKEEELEQKLSTKNNQTKKYYNLVIQNGKFKFATNDEKFKQKWSLFYDDEFLSLTDNLVGSEFDKVSRAQSMMARAYINCKPFLEGKAGQLPSMKEKSFRNWTELQNIPRIYRELFHRHTIFKTSTSLDIDSSALTHLVEYARINGKITEQLATILYSLTNKQDFRELVMDTFEVDYQQAKKIITRLINKGVISTSHLSGWLSCIEDDTWKKTKHKKFMADNENIIHSFYDELKLLHKWIKEIANNDPNCPIKITEGDKYFMIYFWLENNSMTEITNYFLEKGITCIPYHDCIEVSNFEITEEIKQEILSRVKEKLQINLSATITSKRTPAIKSPVVSNKVVIGKSITETGISCTNLRVIKKKDLYQTLYQIKQMTPTKRRILETNRFRYRSNQ